MNWTLIIVAIILVFVVRFLIRFIRAYDREKSMITAHGGMSSIYKVLIDGILEYHSAQIVESKIDYIVIQGTFTDPITNRVCGEWAVSIQKAFTLLNVRYNAYVDLGGGEKSHKSWEFRSDESQEKILRIVKDKADEWNSYGIFK
jgi:hypothetical protein